MRRLTHEGYKRLRPQVPKMAPDDDCTKEQLEMVAHYISLGWKAVMKERYANRMISKLFFVWIQNETTFEVRFVLPDGGVMKRNPNLLHV